MPFLVTDLATAELVKVAANAFLATKISFINAMAEVCEAAGRRRRAARRRRSPSTRGSAAALPGPRPRLRRRLPAQGHPRVHGPRRELGVGRARRFLREVDAINMRRRARMVDLARELAGGSLGGPAPSACSACAFKPDSDDIRDSPALDVAGTVHGLGARVTVYDPAAMDRAPGAPPRAGVRGLDAGRGRADADVMLLLTEWHEFRDADPEVLGEAVAQRNIVDGRNALDAARWRAAGWHYRALGRAVTT